jgi:hypothetical protein
MSRHRAAGWRAAVVLAAYAVLGGCVTAPKAPEWVLRAPDQQDGFMFFVGSGDRGSLAASEETARQQVTEQIMTFVGAEIAARTDATVRATLDSYRADVTRTVAVRGEARLRSLEQVDRWVEANGTAVHVLYRSSTDDLVAEQRRLQGLVREILALVATPEGEAEDLAGDGRYYEAAMKYIQAAAAASGLDIPNKAVKFERNVNAAKDAIGRLNIFPYRGDAMEAVAGREMPEPFQAIVVTGANASGRPVAGVSVRVAYRTLGANARMRTDTLIAVSDTRGVVTFGLPVPRFVGAETITVSLNAGPYLEALQQAPREYQSQIAGLEQLAAQKRATLRYTVVSLAREVPMGIAVADVDAARNPLALTETAAGMLGELSAQKFRVRILPVAAERLVGVGDADVLAYLAGAFGSDVGRVAFGVTQITSAEKDGDRTIVRVRALVKVADFQSGEIRYAADRSASTVGTSAEAASTSAFRRVGELVAQEIAANLW